MNYESRLNIKSWALEDRPREKFAAKGKGSLSDAELIAILLGSGNTDETAVELAKRILSFANNRLDELGKMDLNQLKKFKGIGDAKAVTISAAMELGRRRKSEASKREKVNSSKVAYEIFADVLSDLPHEEFWILLLNRANMVINRINISKGGVSGTVADVKLIFKAAIEQSASSMIVAHNHPSGNLKASDTDLRLTAKLKKAGAFLDIAVLDHIIVGHGAYLSMADEGLM